MLQQEPPGAARLGEERGRGVARGDPVPALGLGHQPAGQVQRVSLPGQALRVPARLLPELLCSELLSHPPPGHQPQSPQQTNIYHCGPSCLLLMLRTRFCFLLIDLLKSPINSVDIE